MRDRLTLAHTFDWLFAVIAAAAFVGVLLAFLTWQYARRNALFAGRG